MQDDIIEQTYDKAINILKMNSNKIGFSASTEKFVNYFSVWARDHSICSIACIHTKDKELIATAKRGIFYLLSKQSDNGQIPSYVEIDNKKKVYGGLGGITSIDSNMWIVIAAAQLYKKTRDKRFLSLPNIKKYLKLYKLLKAFDSNNCGLLEVHIASDWADVMNRTYHVLYDECLFYQYKKDMIYLFTKCLEKELPNHIRKEIMKDIRHLKNKRALVKKRINQVLWFTKNRLNDIKKEYMIYDDPEIRDYEYYQSHISPFKHPGANRFDTFGNMLAILTKVANTNKAKTILRYAIKNGIGTPSPAKALFPPIEKGDPDWEKIYGDREKPYTYHNGGIWPMVGGFWICALRKNNFIKRSKNDLKIMAESIKEQNYAFNEYSDARTNMPLGRTNQAWSAAGYILAYHAVKDDINVF